MKKTVKAASSIDKNILDSISGDQEKKENNLSNSNILSSSEKKTLPSSKKKTKRTKNVSPEELVRRADEENEQKKVLLRKTQKKFQNPWNLIAEQISSYEKNMAAEQISNLEEQQDQTENASANQVGDQVSFQTSLAETSSAVKENLCQDSLTDDLNALGSDASDEKPCIKNSGNNSSRGGKKSKKTSQKMGDSVGTKKAASTPKKKSVNQKSSESVLSSVDSAPSSDSCFDWVNSEDMEELPSCLFGSPSSSRTKKETKSSTKHSDETDTLSPNITSSKTSSLDTTSDISTKEQSGFRSKNTEKESVSSEPRKDKNSRSSHFSSEKQDKKRPSESSKSEESTDDFDSQTDLSKDSDFSINSNSEKDMSLDSSASNDLSEESEEKMPAKRSRRQRRRDREKNRRERNDSLAEKQMLFEEAEDVAPDAGLMKEALVETQAFEETLNTLDAVEDYAEIPSKKRSRRRRRRSKSSSGTLVPETFLADDVFSGNENSDSQNPNNKNGEEKNAENDNNIRSSNRDFPSDVDKNEKTGIDSEGDVSSQTSNRSSRRRRTNTDKNSPEQSKMPVVSSPKEPSSFGFIPEETDLDENDSWSVFSDSKSASTLTSKDSKKDKNDSSNTKSDVKTNLNSDSETEKQAKNLAIKSEPADKIANSKKSDIFSSVFSDNAWEEDELTLDIEWGKPPRRSLPSETDSSIQTVPSGKTVSSDQIASEADSVRSENSPAIKTNTVQNSKTERTDRNSRRSSSLKNQERESNPQDTRSQEVCSQNVRRSGEQNSDTEDLSSRSSRRSRRNGRPSQEKDQSLEFCSTDIESENINEESGETLLDSAKGQMFPMPEDSDKNSSRRSRRSRNRVQKENQPPFSPLPSNNVSDLTDMFDSDVSFEEVAEEESVQSGQSERQKPDRKNRREKRKKDRSQSERKMSDENSADFDDDCPLSEQDLQDRQNIPGWDDTITPLVQENLGRHHQKNSSKGKRRH